MSNDANQRSKRIRRLALMASLLGVSTVLAIVGAIEGIGGLGCFLIGLAMGGVAGGLIWEALEHHSVRLNQAHERSRSSSPIASIAFSLGVTAAATIVVAVEANGGAAFLFLVGLLVGGTASNRLRKALNRLAGTGSLSREENGDGE